MNISKFKTQHLEILGSIAALRTLVQSGIGKNAEEISHCIVTMSSVIKLHLAVEDKFLYPALETQGNRELSNLSRHYREEMSGIKSKYVDFASKWNSPRLLQEQPDLFREEANRVLKLLYIRMKKEDSEFYPAVEAQLN